MALQKSFEKLKNDCFKRIASGQTVVSTRVPAVGGGKISKVLSVSATARVLGCEAFSGEAKINGRVEFKVLYVDDATDNRCAEGGVEFSDKLVSLDIVPALILNPTCMVMDVDTALVTGEEVKLSAVIELILSAVVKENLEYLNTADDLYIQTESLKTQSQSGSFSGDVEISEEFKVGKASRKIMLADASALVVGATCGERSVVVEGRVFLSCVTENEGGTLESVFKLLPFTQEVSAPDVFSTDFAHAEASVSKCDLVLNVEEDGASIEAVLGVAVSGTAFREGEVEVITDAFSVSFETKTTTQSVELTRAAFSRWFEAKIEGTASLETEMPSVDKIITTLAPRINITNVYAENDKIIVEGVLNASVLYYNSELNNLNSVQVELPYSQSINASGAMPTHKLVASGMPVTVSARVRKINEVEVFAEVLFAVSADNTEIYHAVTDVECGAERTASAAVAVYITKSEESLWDVAKNLVTTPELILAQNPTLKLPLTGGERILVYHQLRAKM